jgi:hypothetical protein
MNSPTLTAFTGSSGVGSRPEGGARLVCGAGRPLPLWFCRRGADGAQSSGYGRSSEHNRGRLQAFGPGLRWGVKHNAFYGCLCGAF